jgi:hypothetical protein
MSRYALAKLVGFAIAPAAVIYRPAGRARRHDTHSRTSSAPPPRGHSRAPLRSLARVVVVVLLHRTSTCARARRDGGRLCSLAHHIVGGRPGFPPTQWQYPAHTRFHQDHHGPAAAGPPLAMSPSCMRCGGICECNCCNSALAASRDREP